MFLVCPKQPDDLTSGSPEPFAVITDEARKRLLGYSSTWKFMASYKYGYKSPKYGL